MDLLIAIILVAGSAIGGVVANVIASELYDRAPSIAYWFVERAVGKLPHDVRDRYREEWLAHLEDCPGKLGKLSHAFGVNLNAHRIGAALQISKAANAEENEFRDIFKDPKKVRLLIIGTALMMVGSSPVDFVMLTSNDVPLAIKISIVVTWVAGCWTIYAGAKLLKEIRRSAR